MIGSYSYLTMSHPCLAYASYDLSFAENCTYLTQFSQVRVDGHGRSDGLGFRVKRKGHISIGRKRNSVYVHGKTCLFRYA